MGKLKQMFAGFAKSHSISVGRIGNIRIDLDWTLLVFVLLIGYYAQDWVLMEQPGMPYPLVLLLSVLLGIGWIASVLAHELAHALAGKKLGLYCSSIKLSVFGGVANVNGVWKAQQELIVSAAGPATNIVLGVFLLAASAAFELYCGYFATFTKMLGQANLIVGIVNSVLPIFPMDCGRMLRAVAWMVTKSFRKATVFAVWIGIGCARGFILSGCLMALGIRVPFFGSGVIAGLWLACIGWILIRMAKKERANLNPPPPQWLGE